jgi:Family of unknown function (DUF6152)
MDGPAAATLAYPDDWRSAIQHTPPGKQPRCTLTLSCLNTNSGNSYDRSGGAMNIRVSGAVVALAVGVWATTPIGAHHTVAAVYDATKTVTLSGTVTQVDWQFPHIIFHVDVKDADGSTISWDGETVNPQGMRRHGLTPDFVKAGDAVSMEVLVAKDGTRHAALETITTPTGTTYLSMVAR